MKGITPPTTPHWRRLLGNLPGNTYVQRWHYLLSFFFCLLQRHFRITDRLYCMRYVSAECEWLRAEITAANGSRLSIRVIFFCTCDSPLLDVIMCLKWAVFSWDKFRDLREVKSAVTSAKLIFSIRAKLRPLSFAHACWPDHPQQFQWETFSNRVRTKFSPRNVSESLKSSVGFPQRSLSLKIPLAEI